MTGSVKDLLSVEKPSRYFPFELGRADKKWDNKKLSFCLSYPDSYEIGMSNLGLRIIYSLLNSFEKVVCDRIFCPFSDMEEKYKNQNYDFTSIEHNKKLNEFDVLGFTFQYELLYTNFLTILNLGLIEFDKSKRNDEQPIIIAGGPAMFNPAIMRKFADFIFVGEAEQSLKIFTEYLIDFKNKNASRSYIIQNMPEIEGVLNTHKPSKVKRTWVEDFENCFFPDKWLVPLSSITHDRIFLEIMRGCPHGCRFCQAGFLYRPLRYRSVEKLKNIADKLLEQTGYEEISLASLSTGDYPHVKELSEHIMAKHGQNKVSISLPSLHVESSTFELLEKIQKVRKTGLTFACEAGSQQMRNRINKKIEHQALLEKIKESFEKGWLTVKLYFMIGLPGETVEDDYKTVELIGKCSEIAFKYARKRGSINVAFSTFIPKPFTPFQWEPMLNENQIFEKINFFKKNLTFRNVNMKWHEPSMSVMEGIFSRGDEKLAEVVIKAWENGARFDGWSQFFDFKIWKKTFEEMGIDYSVYLEKRAQSEELPWDIIDSGIKKDYLIKELEKSTEFETTEDCNVQLCRKCGVC